MYVCTCICVFGCAYVILVQGNRTKKEQSKLDNKHDFIVVDLILTTQQILIKIAKSYLRNMSSLLFLTRTTIGMVDKSRAMCIHRCHEIFPAYDGQQPRRH